MEPTIRPARPDDVAAIGEFTADTFEWGDYITDVLPYWLTAENGMVMVAADKDDRAVALGRAEMMSPTELWLQGARVREDYRRRGIASAVGEALVEWAVDQGARVARLLTEGWNEPAQRQVESTGFKRVCDWVVGSRPIAPASPTRSGNGGQRAKARRRLELAHSSEAVPAWVSWRSGPLVGPARGLRATGWRWSQLTADLLLAAGKRGELWSSQAGWVVLRRDGDSLYVDWLDCGPDDIDDMVRSIVDLAVEQHADHARITVPDVDWLVTAVERGGFEPHPMYIYERAL